jgi:hypothetical protein
VEGSNGSNLWQGCQRKVVLNLEYMSDRTTKVKMQASALSAAGFPDRLKQMCSELCMLFTGLQL